MYLHPLRNWKTSPKTPRKQCRFYHLSPGPHLQSRLWPFVQQIRHLEPRPIWVETWCRPFAIPSPFLPQLRCELILQHLDDVLAEHGEELVAVERTACRNVKTLGACVR
jgi:hypothetical protein